MNERAALVLEHEADTPAALLAEWADTRDVPIEVVRAGAPIPDPADRPFLVSLGSEASAYDDAVPWLAAERTALDRALAVGVPVLGICFGAQHLARALGGTVAPAARPEVGWLGVETLAPETVPPGPWLQWHRDAFTLPPGADLLARSPVGPQAFRAGPHLGVQFHPEVTPAIAADWARSFPDSVRGAQTTVAAVLAGSDEHAAGARVRAFALFDAFLATVRAPILG
ncbi:MAG TPA: type 1 glutamine amidotransferase [Baekduia sp.]|uniref:type 1 glutamine amidotransferase n=1 Tax=Baekduia sp. TaxID=2600305 RepID=UPI002CE71223|nr:type 1 glutamine amidotransferase [Baekduia sp.]HMJ37345.1 type 1 glutamine amidotransferase [Baekduia sp.]